MAAVQRTRSSLHAAFPAWLRSLAAQRSVAWGPVACSVLARSTAQRRLNQPATQPIRPILWQQLNLPCRRAACCLRRCPAAFMQRQLSPAVLPASEAWDSCQPAVLAFETVCSSGHCACAAPLTAVRSLAAPALQPAPPRPSAWRPAPWPACCARWCLARWVQPPRLRRPVRAPAGSARHLADRSTPCRGSGWLDPRISPGHRSQRLNAPPRRLPCNKS